MNKIKRIFKISQIIKFSETLIKNYKIIMKLKNLKIKKINDNNKNHNNNQT